MNFENYSCDNQMSIFDFTREPISITKPIRLIELFAGYGSQCIKARCDCGISNLRSDGNLVVKQSSNAD